MAAPRVAIITVSYNHGKWFPALYRSLAHVSYPKDRFTAFLLDNKSADDTLAVMHALEQEVGKTSAAGMDLRIIASETNTGFAGGNNVVMQQAIAEGYDYVYLLNPDTTVEPDFLTNAVAAAEADATVGGVQSLLVLGQEPEKLNSIGNAFHYLGFSFCEGYQAPRATVATLSGTPEIASASGAGVMFRCSVLQKIGVFDEILFAYHEDVDLSLRLRLAGYRLVLAPTSVVYHHYEFSRSIKKYFWMERNRFIVLYKVFTWPTLLLLAPMQIILLGGLWIAAVRGGWWREQWRAFAWFFSREHLRIIRAERAQVQHSRVISDRVLFANAATTISYQEVSSPLLTYIGNPMMRGYYRLVRPFIR